MKKWLTIISLITSYFLYGQCPNTRLFDLELTLASENPVWINCIDNVGVSDDFTLDLISPEDIVNYTIDWGDGSPTQSSSLWSAGSIISHDYTTLGKFIVELTEVKNGCVNTIEGIFISDRKPGATALPPTLNTSGCVPHTLSFTNQTTNVSEFTEFIWDWGDGTTDYITSSTEDGAVNNPIDHIFQKGRSGCGMSVRLTAMSLCDTAFVIYGPYDFFDVDTSGVSASVAQICVGDSVTFDDVTQYNCIPGIRRIMWDLSAFGGTSTDWLPAIPANRTQKFYLEGTVGSTFTIALRDSNFCGVDQSTVTVEVIAPPTSVPLVVDDSICEGDNGQFTNASIGANTYLWDWGDGTGTSTSSTNLQRNQYDSAGIYDVMLIADIANSFKCRDTAFIEIHVSPTPEVSFTTSQDEGCDELTSTFTNTSVPLTSFQWTFSDGTSNTTDDVINKTYLDKGYYIPTLLGTNEFGCQTLVTDTLVVLPQSKVVFNDDSLCFGEAYVTDNRSTIESFPSGTIFHEVYRDVFGSDLDSFRNSDEFKNNMPDERDILTELSFDLVNDNDFASRIRGFIKPTVSGAYKFFVAGNDQAQLYLSSDMDTANTTLLAFTDAFTDFQQWDKFDTQESEFIDLVAGEYYYIELLQIQGGGTAHASVGWQLPNGLLERPIPGDMLTPYFEGLVIENYTWDFGDGSPIVEAKDTSYTYPTPGDYYVKLNVASQSCGTTDSLLVRTAKEIIDSLIFLDTAACTPFELEVIDSTNSNQLIYVFGDGSRDTIDHVLGDTFAYTYFNNTDESRFFNFSATLVGDFGCTENLIQTIEIYPGPLGNIELDVPFPPCAPFNAEVGNTAYDSTYVYTWELNDVGILGDSSLTILSENMGTSLRTDNLSLSILSNNGCSREIERSFNIFPEPNYEIVQSVDSGCSPLDVQFGLNEFAQTYFWEFGDGTFDNTSNPTKVYNLTSQEDSVYNVIVNVLSPFSCPDTIESTIYTQQNLNANFVATPKIQTYPDTTIQLINLSSGPIADYQWILSNDTIDEDTSSYAFSEIGDHIIQLKATNGFCESIHLDTVTILPPVPTSDFVVGDNGMGCENATFQFSSLSLFADTYLWYFGDGTTSTEENPTHTYTTEGVYDVSLKVTGLGGTDSLPQLNIIEIISAPVSMFTVVLDTLFSPDTTFTLVNQSTGVVDSITWLSGDGDTAINVTNVDFSYSEGVYTTGLIVSNSINNCADTSYNDVYLFPPLPVASFLGSDTGCAPLSVMFTNTSQRESFLRWEFGDGTVSFESNPTHIYTDVGLYNVKLFVSNPQGEDSVTVFNVVNVLEQLEAVFTISEDSKNTPDTTFTLTNQSEGDIDSLIWLSDDGDTLYNINVAMFNYQTVGEYIPSLTVSNSFANCEHTVSNLLELLPPLPIASFEGTDTACAPLEITFNNTSSNAQFVQWDFGDGNLSFQTSPTHIYTEPGLYDVKLVVANTQGEDSVTAFNTILVTEDPTVMFEMDKEQSAYPDTVFEFFRDDFEEVDTNVWTLDGVDTLINEPSFSYAFSGFGQKIVELEVRTNIKNCVTTFVDTVYVIAPEPIAAFDGEGEGCVPVRIDFINNTQFGETYFWDFGDGFTSEAFEPSHVYSVAGNYQVKLVATNSSGEDVVTKSNAIKAYDYPTALFTTNPSTDTDITAPSDVFFGNKSLNATSYIWDFGDGTDSDIEEPLHFYQDPGTYFVGLIAANDEGCTDTFRLEPPLVLVEGGNIVVPNAFSPNVNSPSGTGGDIEEGRNNNDIFFPKIKGTVDLYKFYVFNRWGEMVFYTEDISKGWDGYYRGELSKQDVYVYKIEISFKSGRTEILTSDFALIR